MTHKETALQLFHERFLCSQAVVAAFAKECGITEEQAFKLGTAFGTGMRRGEVCGAVTGALMVIGLLYGQKSGSDTLGRSRAYDAAERMMDRFTERCGSYLCSELLGCDIKTEEGRARAVELKLFTEFCPTMVERAVDLLEEIIEEES